MLWKALVTAFEGGGQSAFRDSPPRRVQDHRLRASQPPSISKEVEPLALCAKEVEPLALRAKEVEPLALRAKEVPPLALRAKKDRWRKEEPPSKHALYGP
jgi:hypothetical protein